MDASLSFLLSFVISFVFCVGEIGHLRVLTIYMENPEIPVGNQMVRIIPFGVLLKLWASGQSDAFLLLFLGVTADVHTFCMLSIFC